MSADTIPIRKGEGLDIHKLASFVRRNIDNVPEGSLTIRQFNAGRSNLTYQLKIGDWEAVLRRPPLGPVAPKAHDMKREFSIIKEIHPYFQAAPKPYVFADESVIGTPFFIMERKHGIVLDTSFPDHVTVSKDLCWKISENMVENLVNLHRIDYTQTQLKDMTKPDGFMDRQVHGWIKRYEKSKTDEIKEVEKLKNWLINHIPPSQKATIIHYDYKLNNAMFNQDFSKLVGLFDWEMTTVGDPLVDLAVTLSYWTEENDSPLLKRGLGETPVTTFPGFMTRSEFIEAYSAKSGRDVSNMDFYMTFAYFKLAVICQQIYYRWKQGQTQDDRFASLHLYVNNLIKYALEKATKGI